MNTNTISRDEAALLLSKLLNESTPVVAWFTSKNGPTVVLRGFVESITFENGLLISSVRGRPGTSSTLVVPLPGDPLGSECSFMFGDKREIEDSRREELANKYGDAALIVLLPSGARLNLLFTP
jgi:hypothetical protein